MSDSALRLVTQRHRESNGDTVILFECGHTQRFLAPPDDEIEAECPTCAAAGPCTLIGVAGSGAREQELESND